MTDKERIRFLEKQVDHLSRERENALNALDQAASLGQFEAGLSSREDAFAILEETAERARAMIRFDAVAFYLVNRQTFDFELSHCFPADRRELLTAEVEALIADNSFAWALSRNRGSFFSTLDKSGELMLHPLNTRSGIQGMFVGLLGEDKKDILDTTVGLFTVVMQASGHALETLRFNLQLREINRSLEQKVAERTRQLKDSYEQLRHIIDNLAAGVVLIDWERRTIEDVNPTLARMLEMDRAEIVGRNCCDILCSIPGEEDDCPMVRETNIHGRETSLQTSGGRVLHVLKTATFFEREGRRFVLESFVDISEHHELDELRQHVDRILRHDLKAPLSGIINLPEMVLEEDGLTDMQRDMLGTVVDSGRRMLNMINLSLDMFKMEKGEFEPRLVPVNLVAVVENLRKELSNLIYVSESELQVLVDGREAGQQDRVAALGEELLVHTMLSNLLKNAFEASPSGAVVRVRLDHAEGLVVCRVHNLGAVPEDMRHRFFDKYATSGKRFGTGLGTHSARMIAENLGGTISYTTSEEDGTEVTVTLPAGGHLRG